MFVITCRGSYEDNSQKIEHDICIYHVNFLFIIYCCLLLTDLPGCGSSSGASTVYCREPAGLLISPGFPAKASPLDKRWTIGGILGQYVILSFIEIDIWNEDSGTSHPCPSNFVIVQDFALNGQNTEIGRYCAANNPRTDIKSSWQNLELRYIIEESNGGTGLIAKYRIINYAIDMFTDLHKGNYSDGLLVLFLSSISLFLENQIGNCAVLPMLDNSF